MLNAVWPWTPIREVQTTPGHERTFRAHPCPPSHPPHHGRRDRCGVYCPVHSCHPARCVWNNTTLKQHGMTGGLGVWKRNPIRSEGMARGWDKGKGGTGEGRGDLGDWDWCPSPRILKCEQRHCNRLCWCRFSERRTSSLLRLSRTQRLRTSK